MATIRTAIQIQDGMSPAFKSMNTALNIVLNSFESLQRASHSTIDTASIQAARSQLAQAEIAINNVEEEIRQANEESKKMPEHLNRASSSASGLMSKVTGLAASLGIAFGGAKVIGLSDELAQTTARLDMMNDKQQTTAELQDKIFQATQRSRGAYFETADAVAKLGARAGDIFKSNDETIAFAEQLNKMFVIAGASQQEVSSATLQLTQALGSGVLRGEEFNAVFEAAPNVMQSVADYMKMPIGSLRDMAKEGEITASIVKNALMAASVDTNTKFESMPRTWAQIGTSIKNEALMAFQPRLEEISNITETESFNNMVSGIVTGLATVATYTTQLFQVVIAVGSFFYDNWSIIEPIVWGIVAAVGAYVAVQGIAKLMTLASAAAEGIKAAAVLVGAVATGTATTAQWGLNAALLACPITWIVLVIAAIVAAIVVWINKIGGLKVAWLIVMNALLTAWDILKLASIQLVNNVLDKWDLMLVGMKSITVGIQNVLGDMKANGLSILQNFVNGAIDLINNLINTVNKIPGVSIETISRVTFGTEAQIENQVEKAQRSADLSKYMAEKNAAKRARDEALTRQENEAAERMRDRQAAIDIAKEESATEKAKDNAKEYQPDYSVPLDNTAANTEAIKNSLATSEEDLKYMRDLAEMEVVNRFTTAEVKVELGGITNNVNSNVDLDGVVDYVAIRVQETMEAVAEGVHV